MERLAFSINQHFKLTGTFHVQHILASFLGGKGGLILGREVLNGQVGSKDMHAIGGHRQGLGVVLGGKGLAFHLGIRPERSLQSLLTVRCHTFRCHVTLHHFVVGQVATGEIHQFLLLGLDTVEDGDGLVGRSVIVAPHHGFIVGIGANDGDLLCIFLQRQDIVLVLQQHDALARHFQRDLGRGLGTHRGIGYLRPFHQRRVIHLSEVETAFQQTDDMLVDFCFRNQSATNSLRNTLIGIAVATFHIRSCQSGLG